MLNELQIKEALREALKEYIRLLAKNDFNYMEVKGQIQAYLKILGIGIPYLDINKAKQLLVEVI